MHSPGMQDSAGGRGERRREREKERERGGRERGVSERERARGCEVLPGMLISNTQKCEINVTYHVQGAEGRHCCRPTLELCCPKTIQA